MSSICAPLYVHAADENRVSPGEIVGLAGAMFSSMKRTCQDGGTAAAITKDPAAA